MHSATGAHDRGMPIFITNDAQNLCLMAAVRRNVSGKLWDSFDFYKHETRLSVTEKKVACLHGSPEFLCDGIVFISQIT